VTAITTIGLPMHALIVEYTHTFTVYKHCGSQQSPDAILSQFSVLSVVKCIANTPFQKWTVIELNYTKDARETAYDDQRGGLTNRIHSSCRACMLT